MKKKSGIGVTLESLNGALAKKSKLLNPQDEESGESSGEILSDKERDDLKAQLAMLEELKKEWEKKLFDVEKGKNAEQNKAENDREKEGSELDVRSVAVGGLKLLVSKTSITVEAPKEFAGRDFSSMSREELSGVSNAKPGTSPAAPLAGKVVGNEAQQGSFR